MFRADADAFRQVVGNLRRQALADLGTSHDTVKASPAGCFCSDCQPPVSGPPLPAAIQAVLLDRLEQGCQVTDLLADPAQGGPAEGDRG